MQINIKGRGAQINPNNRFLKEHRGSLAINFPENVPLQEVKTQYLNVEASSILNKVISPDVPGDFSMNPYQGCEHGCVYCYARNTHPYWGYSAGLDFESKIIIKQNAAELLDKELSKKSWKATPIMLSGNTDCYQPIERKTALTRKILEVFWKHRHPVSIVTKNNLILRDLDILKNLAIHHLVTIAISINTLDEELRQKLEPRTSSINKRFNLVKQLAQHRIPVTVLAAPIIPGLNDTDILPLVKRAAEAGARNVKQIIVRLNGDIGEIFTHWIDQNYPDRRDKIINKIKSLHGGKLNNSNWGARMEGQGRIADIIHQQFDLAKRLYLLDDKKYVYNTDLYHQLKDRQLSLF
jgi:DNA repair photolyase